MVLHMFVMSQLGGALEGARRGEAGHDIIERSQSVVEGHQLDIDSERTYI